MNYDLRDYQNQAVKKMRELPHLALFLEPGLGKTLCVLHYIWERKISGAPYRTLVIAPKRVRDLVWPAEIRKFNLPLSFKAICSPYNDPGKFNVEEDIVSISSEAVSYIQDPPYRWFYNQFDILVVDESTKFKNPKALRTRCLLDVVDCFSRRYILTGTPRPNGYQDLYSQMEILKRGLLGRSSARFLKKYFRYIPSIFTHILKAGCDQLIDKLIRPYVLMIRSKDVLSLPEATEIEIGVKLSAKHLKTYKKLYRDLEVQLEGHEVTARNRVTCQNLLRQYASGAVYLKEKEYDLLESLGITDFPRAYQEIHKVKIEALKELIDELEGEPLLVAYAYKHEVHRFKREFKSAEFLESISSQKKAAQLERAWNAREIPVLFVHPASMKFGINLQDGGNHVCWASLTYDYEEYFQFNSRLDRGGQNETVFIHRIIAKDTIDESIYNTIKQKESEELRFKEKLK